MTRHTISLPLAILASLSMTVSAFGGDGNYANPWVAGDLFVNMSGESVRAARADDDGYEPSDPSASVQVLLKSSFVDGWVTQKDPLKLSDLYVTAPGDDDGTLYRINRSDGSIDTLNTSIAMGNGGITSDGSHLYINDDSGNIDLYNFDGTLDTDNLVTGVTSGGFSGTNQVHYYDGFLFIATGGAGVQYASASGGAAASLATGIAMTEVPGAWAGGGKFIMTDSGTNQVNLFDVDTSGAVPLLSNNVLEGTETGAGGFLGGVTADLAAGKIYAGSAGSFGSGFPGEVLAYDIDGDVETDDNISILNVVTGLPNGGAVNPYLITGVPEPSSIALALLAAVGCLAARRRSA